MLGFKIFIFDSLSCGYLKSHCSHRYLSMFKCFRGYLFFRSVRSIEELLSPNNRGSHTDDTAEGVATEISVLDYGEST